MTTAVAKISSGTIGRCFCHRFPIFSTGMIISNISGLQMMVDGMPVATQMSVVRSKCGHYGVVITGSSVVKHNGIGIARRFDTGVGCYNFTIIGGATNVNTVLF